MSSAQSSEPAIRFEGTCPILRVANLQASQDYYVNVLGFKVDWGDPDIMISVSRGRCSLMLSAGDQGHPGTWVWVGVSDAERLFEEYRAKGAKIRHPPTNYAWALEMQVEDPDGHVLRMGSEPKADEPFGDWLDMKGDSWRKNAAGRWVKVT